ncbi:TonB-dependent siderophore receptor [Flavobacterium sp. Fl-77]|uniref:TonB-dependent siderophore receptor n=1 Tax=Flavobacterium flavipigmentatum TaxID=2893884 RepID=A0AAJ2SBV4_9FLAO|nr:MULTISPECIES: TonB-dependent siderophore receptor [unclassified Flavobacterium]MDX6181450.1 TonB-dependent siderophore receptor [Flavobacterium sp. Fl-33]MDX6185516.1 TonB-dependent siderophore receptor [Flavobacterium sp. Fl-77]UFH37619.1 TonB-dependent receptor [Flavobacterium sp. F-70]
MKHLHLILFLFLGMNIINAQQITGKITDSDTKEGIVGATIKLLNSDLQTTTATDGNFAIEGEGILEITALGYKTIQVKSGAKFLNIEISSDRNELQTVEILGRASKKYNSDYSFSATKIAALNKDIPQSISTITKELIADKNAFYLADAVKMASGVIPSSYYNQYSIRGISQNEEGQIINGMRTRQYYFLQPLTNNIERVEVIKGPSSATFSSVDPGGSINLVTKKPLAVDRKEVSLSVGSFSTFRGTLDFTGPLNESKTLLYRVNGAYQEAKSFRDLVGNKSFLISPSFSYIPNEKTAINTELILSDMTGNLDRGQPIFGAVAGTTNLNKTPISLNLGAPNDFFKSKEMILMTNFAHKFTSKIGFNASYMKQSWTENLQEHRTTNAFAVDINNQPVASLAMMQFVQRQQYWNVDNLNAYFNFDFKTGKLRHKLLTGYDLSSWNKTKGGGQNAARGYLLKDGTVASTFVLANADNYQTTTIDGVVLPKPNVNYFNLNTPAYTLRNIEDYTLNVRTALPSALTTTNAIYIQDQIHLAKFTFLLGLRNEWFEDITNYETTNELTVKKSALLPRVGVTYAINDAINIYTTYLEGYQPQSNTVTLMPQTGSLPAGSLFDPLESNLKEFGAKATLFNNKISINAAVYEINQRNILMNANDPNNPDLLVTRGAERSRGFECDIAGYITSNWQINASYSYIDAEITNDREASLIGARKQNTPKNSANLWTRYNFDSASALSDFGIGLGMQYQSSKIPWFTRDFTIPDFTVFDAALYYKPTKSNMQIAINAGNLLNKTYWLGAQNYLRLFPGATRNATITVTYKF